MRDEKSEQGLAHIKNELHGKDRFVRVDMSQRMQKDRQTIKEMTQVTLHIQREYQVETCEAQEVRNKPQTINIQIEDQKAGNAGGAVCSISETLGKEAHAPLQEETEANDAFSYPEFQQQVLKQQEEWKEQEEVHNIEEELEEEDEERLEEDEDEFDEDEIYEDECDELDQPECDELESHREIEEEDESFDWEQFLRDHKKILPAEMEPYLEEQAEYIPSFQKQYAMHSRGEPQISQAWEEPQEKEAYESILQRREMLRDSSQPRTPYGDATFAQQSDRFAYFEQKNEKGPIRKRDYEQEPLEAKPQVDEKKYTFQQRHKEKSDSKHWISEHKFVFYTILIMIVDIVLAILLQRQESIFRMNNVDNISYYVCIVMKYVAIIHLVITIIAAYRDKVKLNRKRR